MQKVSGSIPLSSTKFLREDVKIAEQALLRLISVPITDGQFDALVFFTFNLGAGALQCSTLGLKVKLGDTKASPLS